MIVFVEVPRQTSSFSRELSAKVFAGQCRLIEIGYRQGGPAGYGLRRMLVDQNGTHKGELARGEHKSIQTDRVILVPGAPVEIGTVRWMYRAFVEEGKLEQEIADLLNRREVQTEDGRPCSGRVHQVLTNPKYVGDNVWNRISYKLKKMRVRNDPEMWVRSKRLRAACRAAPVRRRPGNHSEPVPSIVRGGHARPPSDTLSGARPSFGAHH
jgi:hypothetical protein